MSQVTTIVKRLDDRVHEIRLELAKLLSKTERSAEEEQRVKMFFESYIAASNTQLGLSNADAKLSPGSASYIAVQLNETVDANKDILSFKYTKLPPVPKDASAEYSRAG